MRWNEEYALPPYRLVVTPPSSTGADRATSGANDEPVHYATGCPLAGVGVDAIFIDPFESMICAVRVQDRSVLSDRRSRGSQ